MQGHVIEISVANKAGDPMQSKTSAQLIAGKGIEGDRYFSNQGTFSEQLKGKPECELTLIEKEEIDQFNSDYQQNCLYSELRRNIITQEIRLNDLVGKTFYVGEVLLKGIRLCEPCQHLAETVNPLSLPHLIGRCGLRAQILENGSIQLGDTIEVTI